MKKNWDSKKFLVVASLLLLVAAGFGVFKMLQRLDQKYPWLWMYLGDQFHQNPADSVQGPQHVLFLFVDHFEPHDQEGMSRWVENYPRLAARHRDAEGRAPQHTWFWYFSESDEKEKLSFLRQLAELAYQDLGEVELHLHHDHDNEKTFLEKINGMITLSQKTGAMITRETKPQTAFGFIHGLWSLDNSRGPGACGVNNELMLLRRVGCYADFTHPSWGPMHPRIVNRLYYATDDPARPKSYDTGNPMKVGSAGVGDLLIFEGPSVVGFNSPKPVYDHGDVSHEAWPTPKRIDGWIRQGIHVEGRPEWIFVKVFTHGALAKDHEAVLGKEADEMYSYLEKRYNDGTRYVLHYVTAREAYNIAKAAEAGKSGNPHTYRDFLIPPYVNRYLVSSKPYETISFDGKQAVVRFSEKPGTQVDLRIRSNIKAVSGDATSVVLKPTEGETLIHFTLIGNGVVGFER